MHRYALLLGLFLFHGALSAQDFLDARAQIRQNPERVQQRLNAMTPAIKATVDHQLQQAYLHFYQDEIEPLDALVAQLTQRALTPYQAAVLYFIQGRHQGLNQGDYDAALRALQQGVEVLAAESEPLSQQLRLEIMITTGGLLNYRRRLDEGETLLREALALAEQLENEAQQAEAHYQLGKNYRYQEQASPASLHYQQALALGDAVAEPTFPGRMLMELARLYRVLGGFDQALEYGHRAVQTLEPTGHKGYTSNALTDLGNIYRDAGNITQALHHYYLARDLLVADKSFFGVARTQHDIGTTLLDAGLPEQGLPLLEEAQQMFEQRQHQRFLLANGLSLGQTLVALERWPEAQARLEPLLERVTDPAHRKILLIALATSLHAQGQVETAWPLLQEAAELSGDSGKDDSQLKAAHQFAIEQMRQEVNTLTEQRDRAYSHFESQKWGMMILAIAIGVLALMLAVLLHRLQRKHTELNQARQDSLTQGDSGIGNRDALYQALRANPTGHLVLLRLGDLPCAELRLGRYQFAQLRKTAAQSLSELDWIEGLFEPSPGTLAVLLVPGQEICPRLQQLFRRVRRNDALDRVLQAPMAAGVIPLPFQSGALLRPTPSLSLELVQLALCSACDLADRKSQDSYVKLRPVAFSAPQLAPAELYASALRSIEQGSIKVVASADRDQLRWPTVWPKENPATLPTPGDTRDPTHGEADTLQH